MAIVGPCSPVPFNVEGLARPARRRRLRRRPPLQDEAWPALLVEHGAHLQIARNIGTCQSMWMRKHAAPHAEQARFNYYMNRFDKHSSHMQGRIAQIVQEAVEPSDSACAAAAAIGTRERPLPRWSKGKTRKRATRKKALRKKAHLQVADEAVVQQRSGAADGASQLDGLAPLLQQLAVGVQEAEAQPVVEPLEHLGAHPSKISQRRQMLCSATDSSFGCTGCFAPMSHKKVAARKIQVPGCRCRCPFARSCLCDGGLTQRLFSDLA